MGDEVDLKKRRFLLGATSAFGTLGLAAAAAPFLRSWMPSAQAEAAGAPVTCDIESLKEGERMIIQWRGKPVWIIHRSQTEIQALSTLTDSLRDPFSATDQQPTYAHNVYRSIKPAFLVLIGICTHLGCSPLFKPEPGSVKPGWPGGFYCPCHGSLFDLAGRVYKGVPAPTNLEVPPYRFLNNSTLIIGENATAT